MSTEATDNPKVDCLKCKHFAVTWQPGTPKACKLYGFKSALLPSGVVYQTSGKPCMGFQAKEPRA